MEWPGQLWRKLMFPFHRGRFDRDLEEELRFHLEMKAAEIGPQAARRRFGNVALLAEDSRDAWGWRWLEDLLQDIRYSLRGLRRNRAFAAMAVLTLALGIGAGTALFSVANGVLLRPLPYKDPASLVLVSRDNIKTGSRLSLFSNADWFDLRDAAKTVFDDVGGVTTTRAFVPREDGTAEQLTKALATTNFFRLMGARIAYGRDFTAADGQPQPEDANALIPPGSAAILSYDYFERRYAGSPTVLGREMRSTGRRGPRIVGVLAPGFQYPPGAPAGAAPDFWVANNLGYDNAHRNLVTVEPIARLKRGVTLARARPQVDAYAAGARKKFPDANADMHLRLEPLQSSVVAQVRPAILALMAAVIFLLLIACANVANLLLVRVSLRERELAVRAALGGGRWRLVRQMMAEVLVLAVPGVLAGIGFACAAVRALPAIAPPNLPRVDSIAIDWRVLAFAAASGLASVALFGVAPALRAARPDLIEVLRGGGRAAGPRSGRRLRNAVVAGEVALSFVLLIGSGLMFRSFLALRQVDPGYRPGGVLTFMLARDWPLIRQEGRLALLRRFQDGLAAVPGVESASASVGFPLAGGPGRPVYAAAPSTRPARGSAEGAGIQMVLPGYFETFGTPLLAGRTFTEADNAPDRKVTVIDQLLAARAFPGESAVGQRIQVPYYGPLEVIGVVAHQRTATLAAPGREAMYLTDGFTGIGVSRHWAVRTTGDPANLAGAVRAAIARIDPQLVVTQMQPMEALVARDRAGTRFSLLLIAAFAAIAVLLASVGLYGVLAAAVRQRTAEIGLRMALGAAPAGIFTLVVGQGLPLIAAGLALGLAAALALTRLMAGTLVGVRPADPATFAAATALFLAIAAAASWLPARRAAALDPNAALREE